MELGRVANPEPVMISTTNCTGRGMGRDDCLVSPVSRPPYFQHSPRDMRRIDAWIAERTGVKQGMLRGFSLLFKPQNKKAGLKVTPA